MSNYSISYYFMQIFSSGLDGHGSADTLEDALRQAKAKVKEAGGSAHATITQYGGLVATVAFSRGRLTVKKTRR